MISAVLIGVEQIIISKTSWRNIKRKLLDDIRRQSNTLRYFTYK